MRFSAERSKARVKLYANYTSNALAIMSVNGRLEDSESVRSHEKVVLSLFVSFDAACGHADEAGALVWVLLAGLRSIS